MHVQLLFRVSVDVLCCRRGRVVCDVFCGSGVLVGLSVMVGQDRMRLSHHSGPHKSANSGVTLDRWLTFTFVQQVSARRRVLMFPSVLEVSAAGNAYFRSLIFAFSDAEEGITNIDAPEAGVVECTGQGDGGPRQGTVLESRNFVVQP